jgi:hypothetical protein
MKMIRLIGPKILSLASPAGLRAPNEINFRDVGSILRFFQGMVKIPLRLLGDFPFGPPCRGCG